MPITNSFFFPHRPSFNSLVSFGMLAGWIVVLLLISDRISLIFTHIPFNYNEGWNAYLSERAIGLVQTPLYPDPDKSLIFNNYPPLSFYLVGWFGYITGDMVWAGRILALFAWLGTMGLIFRIILQAGGNRFGAHIGVLLFALFSSYFFHSYVAMNDPQWMAHFFMVFGFSFIIKKQNILRIVVAAIFFIIGGLIKHNLIALPLVVTGWLFIRDKKLALLWVILGLTGVIVSTIGFNALYHNHFMLEDILHHKRVITFHRFLKAMGRLSIFLPMFIVALPFLLKSFRAANKNIPFLLSAFVFLSLFLAVFESLGEGVSYNVFFESLIAFSLVTGLVFSDLESRRRPFVFSMLGAFLPILATAAFYLPHFLIHEHRLHREKQQWDEVISHVRQIKIPVVCDISEICYWAGKPYKLDFFNFYQAVKRGASLEPLNEIIVTPEPTTMVRITLANKHPTYAPLWQIILSHPHKIQTISPHVDIIEIIRQKKDG